MKWGIIAAGLISLSLGGHTLAIASSPEDAANNDQVVDSLMALQTMPNALEAVAVPKIDQPQWYKDQVAAEQAAAAASRRASVAGRTVSYSISTRGLTSSNLEEFAQQAYQTLNDPRGWSQLGLKFQQVPSGGDFNLILSEASQVPSFAPGACSAEWSCRVGTSVIINDMRWAGGTPAWNAAGGGIRDYRHMVVNHEVGHWLGHGHPSCSAPGSYAPVMLQQSIDLQGCKFNPWPLPSELWTSR